MTDHDPRTADVLENLFFFGLPDTALESIDAILAALAAAGMVVRPVDEYERVEWHWADDCCNRPVLDSDWPDNPDARPLYVRKENPDD